MGGHKDPAAASASPWDRLYKGKKFSVRSLFPPSIWAPMYLRSVKGVGTVTDRPIVGNLPFSPKGDLIAGLTVGVMLVPQCLAFALLAGLPVQVGLYASFMPLIAYASFGTLRQVQLGPTALMSLISGQALDAIGITDPNGRMAGAALMALFVGAISICLGALRFGHVVHFMSHTVLSAFCTAAGITIATSQIKYVLGVHIPRHHYWWETVVSLIEHVGELQFPTLVMALTILTILMTLRKWKAAGSAEKRGKHFLWRFFPKDKTSIPFRSLKFFADLSSLAAVLLGALWAWAYRAAGIHTDLVGKVDAEGLVFVMPGAGYYEVSFKDSTLIVSALMIAVIGFLETVAVGSKFASQSKYTYDPNQELIALGMSNFASGFMSGFPVTGGFSRTAVNVTFGATSLLSCAISSSLVLLAIYVLLPAIALLPLACMAPIIIQGAIVFVDFHEFKVAYQAHPREFVVMSATLVTCLVMTVKEGLLVGFVCSVLKTLVELGNPNMAVCVRVRENWRDIRFSPKGEQVKNAVVVRMDAQLHFANAQKLKDFCIEAVRVRESLGDPVEYLIIDGKSINRIDLSSCTMLEELAEALSTNKQKLIFTNLKAPTAATLHTAGVHRRLWKYDGHLCLDLHDAIGLIGSAEPNWEAEYAQVLELARNRERNEKANSSMAKLSSLTEGKRVAFCDGQGAKSFEDLHMAVSNVQVVKVEEEPIRQQSGGSVISPSLSETEEACSPRQIIATMSPGDSPEQKASTEELEEAELTPLALLAGGSLPPTAEVEVTDPAKDSGDESHSHSDAGDHARDERRELAGGGRGRDAGKGRCASGFGASLVGCFGPVAGAPDSSLRARGGGDGRR